MRKITRLLLLLISAPLISCSTISDHIPGVYRLDIEQGNIIDQTIIDELRPNMTKRQVLYILGSPMLIDVFHQKRWDYIYSKQTGSDTRQQQRISLFFEDDTLVGVQGDYRPSTLPVAKVKTDTTVDVPKREEEATVFGEIVKLFSFDDQPSPKNEKDTAEESKAEKQPKPTTAEQKLTPKEQEKQPQPDTDQDISTDPDPDLEGKPENRMEQEISGKNNSKTIDSEPTPPEQPINSQTETAEQIEKKAVEDAEKQEQEFTRKFEKLSKPPVIQTPE